jgi:hypothetical protein
VKVEPSSKKVKVEESFKNYKTHVAFEERGKSFGTQLFKENYNNRSFNCEEVCLILGYSPRIVLLSGH